MCLSTHGDHLLFFYKLVNLPYAYQVNAGFISLIRLWPVLRGLHCQLITRVTVVATVWLIATIWFVAKPYKAQIYKL